MLAIVRDQAHKIRIATRDPLVREDAFNQWYADVFDNKHALVPDIKNSDGWTEKLILCQKKARLEHSQTLVCGLAP